MTGYRFLLCLLCLFGAATADGPTRIFINWTPGYSALPACALQPLSTLVRDMMKGCGDGSQYTSYACFCTRSYSKVGWDISTEVKSKCGTASPGAVTSAVQVFHDYCASGTTQLATTAAISTRTAISTSACCVCAARCRSLLTEEATFAAPTATKTG